MKILLLLAGVTDIRFPLHTLTINKQGLIEEGADARRVLSPFDEAALEIALKLRDARDNVQVDVLLLGGTNNEALLRTVAAMRPDSVRRLDLQPACLWDAQLTSSQIAALLADEATPDLVLIGREFGDLDEGSIAVLLAQRLGYPLFALTQHAEWQGDTVYLLRERGISEEWLRVDQPLLVSVTNDKRNKLRHPLMKNVFEAKRMTFAAVTAGAEDGIGLPLISLNAERMVERAGKCQFFEGGITLQAEALAAYLIDRRT
ncbi:electron transfer flavoprotein subunit beta [Pseudomonas sp.]|uniref:electron transfer flavoprotein subunit beta/FixA family protein n=1 Tax=Pseudomonas sp. TaxID=306 RepID=UPI002635BC22|nr:electron transfer flavoprotein subunit beta [Pseudomonas sp.]